MSGQRARLAEALVTSPAYRYQVVRHEDSAVIMRFVYKAEAKAAARRYSKTMRERFRFELTPEARAARKASQTGARL